MGNILRKSFHMGGKMNDLERAVLELHSALTITLDFHRTPRGRIYWTKTIKGEDFLDGPWTVTFEGSAKNHKTAMKNALRTEKK